MYPVLTHDLPSVYESLETVVEDMEGFLTAHVDDGDLAYRVLLLASEAVTNAIEHGNGLEAVKRVRLECKVLPKRVELMVEDEGGGFDREAIQNPVDAANLMRDTGRGIYLIETMADEVRYEQHGRRVRMSFRRRP